MARDENACEIIGSGEWPEVEGLEHQMNGGLGQRQVVGQLEMAIKCGNCHI